MRVTTGFVAVTADGTFLSLGTQTRWGNESTWCYPAVNIEEATVLPFPKLNCVYGRLSAPRDMPEHRFIPVEVRREVVQTGWGVAETREAQKC